MHRPGIEPGSADWKSAILPFNYQCGDAFAGNRTLVSPLATVYSTIESQMPLVSVDGFEPPT